MRGSRGGEGSGAGARRRRREAALAIAAAQLVRLALLVGSTGGDQRVIPALLAAGCLCALPARRRVGEDRGSMDEQPKSGRGGPRPIGELYRELIRAWGRDLRARGFTDEQVARLVYTKLLFIRGRLRR